MPNNECILYANLQHLSLLNLSVALISFTVVEVSFKLEFIHGAVGLQGISSLFCNHVMKRAMPSMVLWTF